MQPRITVLEALSASGLRALRYWKEVRGLTHIVANDLSEAAVATIRRNISLNGVSEADVEAHHGDATLYMHELRSKSKRFTVVDLDPYGSAAPFLDAAVQAVEEGGLLMVTCTDMAVLSGNHHDACWAKYGVMPIHAKYCHEMVRASATHALL